MWERTVTCNVEIAQCEDETVKCEKKVKEPSNLTKELLYVMLKPHNVRMESSNVRKKKVKEPPNMRKNYHMWFGAAQCENEIVKC